MKIKIHGITRQLRKSQSAFSLVEASIGMGVVGTAALALFSGFSNGIFTMQLARENLRATQVLLEKTETVRLYSWDQVNTPGFIPSTFTAFYDPNDTNSGSAIAYQGTMVVTNCPVGTAYAADMKKAIITLNWQTGSLQRSRSFTTYLSRNGLQSYIY